mgnify:CR=1 FL=1
MDLKRITPQEAYDLMEDEGYVYIDVRTEPEFEGGHPEGAYNIPFMVRGPAGLTPNPDFLKTVEANFPKDFAKIRFGTAARSADWQKQIEAAGQKFDPHKHQAMFEVPNTEVPEGTVVQVVQEGFAIGERVLRPAMVGVSKGGPAAPPAPNGENIDKSA